MYNSLKVLALGLFSVISSIQATNYTPGITDPLPAHVRDEMRAQFQQYTRDNQTTAYFSTCGYMDVLIAEGKKRGLAPSEILNLAYENVEIHSKTLRSCVSDNVPSVVTVLAGIPHPDSAYVCRGDGARLDIALEIRRLIYVCALNQGMFPIKQNPR